MGLPGSRNGGSALRDEGQPLSRDLPRGRRLGDGKRVPVLGGGERGLERRFDRARQPRLVRAIRVARRGGHSDSLG